MLFSTNINIQSLINLDFVWIQSCNYILIAECLALYATNMLRTKLIVLHFIIITYSYVKNKSKKQLQESGLSQIVIFV